jgi:hypothetical protein
MKHPLLRLVFISLLAAQAAPHNAVGVTINGPCNTYWQ